MLGIGARGSMSGMDGCRSDGRTLRLILDLEVGETARGMVGPVDGSRVGFHGWIGLMSAIYELCSQAGEASYVTGTDIGVSGGL